MGSSIPAWGTKILEAVWHGQKNSKKKLIIQKKLLNTLILKKYHEVNSCKICCIFCIISFQNNTESWEGRGDAL